MIWEKNETQKKRNLVQLESISLTAHNIALPQHYYFFISKKNKATAILNVTYKFWGQCNFERTDKK